MRQDGLDAFMGRYVTLHVAAQERAIHFRRLGSMLTKVGIGPVFDPATVHATFYDRKFLLRVHRERPDRGSATANPVEHLEPG